MMVYELDENNFYTGFTELTEENKDTLNYTTKQMTIGYINPKFDFDLDEWIEGATQQEIDDWNEANKPKPSEPTQDDKITLCLEQIAALEEENMILSEYVLGLEMKSLEQEETTTMTNEYVLDLDMRLTNIETK